MMKKTVFILTLGLLAFFVRPSHAKVTFDASQDFLVFGDSRWDGTNRHFGFSFDVGGDVTAGFFFEEGNWNWKGDVGAAAQNTITMSAHLNGLRALKTFGRFLSAGIEMGTAQLNVRAAGGAATLANAAPLSQTKPFVGIMGRAKYNVSSQKGVSSGLHMDLGYRFLDLNDVAIGALPAGETTFDDLNAFRIGIGVHFSF